jgi:Domain of unknown function (DUF4224)
VFLSEDDVAKLTGYVRRSAQIRWLTQHGWRFAVNGLGQPIVSAEEVSRRMVGGATRKAEEPNWAAMNEVTRVPRVRK